MFEIIIILLMKNKYLMILSPDTTNIDLISRERERERERETEIVSRCLDNYLAALALKYLYNGLLKE